MQHFKQLKIWQQGVNIATHAYQISSKLSPSDKYGIAMQITKAAVLIPSSIAEGCSRKNAKEYRQFLETSLGYAFELETLLITIQSLRLANDSSVVPLLSLVIEEQKMIIRLIKNRQ